MNGTGKKIYVGLSGGVDSSVSAYLLKKAGYDVTGVFIKVWQPDFIPCTWREDRLDAMRVSALLDIPFKTLDLEEEYKREVIDVMLAEYLAGRTPNPDVLCNQQVKFGAFLSWALKDGADYIATGHYAQISHDDSGSYHLLRGADSAKDQAYFLYTLGQSELSKTLFPVGGMKKTEVRELAKAAGLPTATKKDSQGLCFISNVDMKDFLSHFIEVTPGFVLDEAGREIGKHQGVTLATIGERHGFTVYTNGSEASPQYVIAKDIEANTLTVSSVPPQVGSESILTLVNTHFVAGSAPLTGMYDIETQYHGPVVSAALQIEENGAVTLSPEMPIRAAGGQSLVVYKGDECLGGGIIV